MDTAIVGCGPAGIATAVQLKRAGVDFLLFERRRVGGLLTNANLVENYPGFPAGISGVDLVGLMRQHLEAASIEVIPEEISALTHSGSGFTLVTGGKVFRSKTVVLATGTRPRPPDGMRIESAAQGLILNEIVPILDAHDKDIVIVGAGDAAFDYALNLGRRNRIEVLNRTDRVRCLDILRKRALALSSITYHEHAEVLGVMRASEDRLSIRYRMKGQDRNLETHHLVLAIGREPERALLSGPILESYDRLCEEGLLYLVGDVRRGERRQTSIAVGDGVKAAMDICDKLRSLGK